MHKTCLGKARYQWALVVELKVKEAVKSSCVYHQNRPRRNAVTAAHSYNDNRYSISPSFTLITVEI
jgi:hypothetical protein